MNLKILLFKSFICFLLIPFIFIIGTFIKNDTDFKIFLFASLITAVYFGYETIIQIRKDIFGEN